MVLALSKQLPRGTQLYLGNSLSIREWDLAASPQVAMGDVWASRGLNGIDGQVSTFLGYAEAGTDNWAILGDLTALYDLPAPWILSQLPGVQMNLVVINNEGGKIFSRMFKQPEFQNQHQLRFDAWARLWGLQYERWSIVPLELGQSRESRIIEMLPDEQATARFWERFQKL